MIKVLFAANPKRWDLYEAPLRASFDALDLNVDLSLSHPADQVDYIIYAPDSELKDFTPYTSCKAVLNLWAGVEAITRNPTLTQPLCRMVDPGLTQGMIEWVIGHSLRYHLDIDHWIDQQHGSWAPKDPPLAQNRKITLLGLGQLGQACAQALAQIGFDVSGWSRRAKGIEGIRCTSGSAGLKSALSEAEIVILLLPDTPDTEDLLNTETLAYLPQGARIINPGRGPLIDDDALLAALDRGAIAHATLDAFRIEPLPSTHPYWTHPNVTVTPHIAATTRPETASNVVAENIKRSQNNAPLLHLVDRAAGY